MSQSHTAAYWFIELALAEHAQRFDELDRDMSAFVPEPREAFEPKGRSTLKHLQSMNPHRTPEQLSEFVEKQIDIESSERVQFVDKFGDRMARETVSIVMLSHALCEALINAVLALGLLANDQRELFNVLESASLKLKWTAGPKAFLSKYEFPRSGALYETLNALCRRRNVFVHSKITIRDEHRRPLMKGSDEERFRIDAVGREWLKRFFRLPYELQSHICNQTEDESLKFHFSSLLGNYGKLR